MTARESTIDLIESSIERLRDINEIKEAHAAVNKVKGMIHLALVTKIISQDDPILSELYAKFDSARQLVVKTTGEIVSIETTKDA